MLFLTAPMHFSGQSHLHEEVFAEGFNPVEAGLPRDLPEFFFGFGERNPTVTRGGRTRCKRGSPCLLDLYEMGRDRATFVIRDWMKNGIRVVGGLNKLR